MNEFGRVQRQFRCHKALIVKTPLHEVPVAGTCTLAPQSRTKECVLPWGSSSHAGRFEVLFVREIWPDPVAYHLPPSASAEIFTKERIQEAQKNAVHSEKCISLQEHLLSMKCLQLYRRVYAYICSLRFIPNKNYIFLLEIIARNNVHKNKRKYQRS